MKPDFNSMSKAELKAYVLAHRNDNEAFYTLVNRYEADSKDQVWHNTVQLRAKQYSIQFS
jgi:hypothetical protein